MTSELSTISQLLLEIQRRAAEVLDAQDPREGLDQVFIRSISRALDDIRRGADVDQFQELSVANLLLSATDAGYSNDEIRRFVQALKKNRD